MPSMMSPQHHRPAPPVQGRIARFLAVMSELFEESMAELDKTHGPASEMFRWQQAALWAGLVASTLTSVLGVVGYVVLVAMGRPSVGPLMPAFVMLAMLAYLAGAGTRGR